MTPNAKDESRPRRVSAPVHSPIRVELTNEEILADLNYPAGRQQPPASRRRLA